MNAPMRWTPRPAASARRSLLVPIFLGLLLTMAPAVARAEGGAHADPSAAVVLRLALILLAAKLGSDLAVRVGQPAVLGELTMGVVLGNLGGFGVHFFEIFKTDPAIDLLARLGVLLLLFEVGLESTVGQMLKVGVSSFLVALLGVVAPFALGWGVGAVFLPGSSVHVHAFLGATLSATSVGITARVLKDLGKSQTQEARIILGAAVIDDVLGLVILAVVTGMIAAADRGGAISYGTIALIVIKAVVFLVASLAIGVRFSPRLFRLAARLQARGVLLALGLAFCFLLAWLASALGLAPIVGAFAAGLILEDVHYKEFTDRGEHGLEELIAPISSFLAPVFFVVMGLRTDLAVFADLRVLGLAGALTVAAVLGKQVCSLGVVGKGVDRLSVGLGMIPRGEVGLIFANVGATLTLGGQPVVSHEEFSAVVVMVIVTTMFTPPALKWSLGRERRPARA
jgi:Kef-type K+ transport system membrane component KefB